MLHVIFKEERRIIAQLCLKEDLLSVAAAQIEAKGERHACLWGTAASIRIGCP
jgi:hypothetical protein